LRGGNDSKDEAWVCTSGSKYRTRDDSTLKRLVKGVGTGAASFRLIS
jgi:hypothetical protein